MLTETITWTPVACGLPDADITVLVKTQDCVEPVWLGYTDGERWYDTENAQIVVTHWAQVPAGPDGLVLPSQAALDSARVDMPPGLTDAEKRAFMLGVAAAPDHRAVMQQALDALETARTGLEWYRDIEPEHVDGSDDEADDVIGNAMQKLREALGVQVPVVTEAMIDAAIAAGPLENSEMVRITMRRALAAALGVETPAVPMPSAAGATASSAPCSPEQAIAAWNRNAGVGVDAAPNPQPMPPRLLQALARRNFRAPTDMDDLIAMAANIIAEDGFVIDRLQAKLASGVMTSHTDQPKKN